MKASTPELMKFQRLMRRLKESKRGTIGLLEGMWLAVGKNCPRGDIGKFSNEEIAIMCDWEGDCDELVNALIDCGWLDVCSVERLVVHDWEEHCPTYIKGNLHSRGQQIAIATCYSEPQEAPQQAAIAPPSEHSTTYPILTYPNQTNSIQDEPKTKKSADAVGFDDVGFLSSHDTPDMRTAWDDWVRFRKRKRKPISDSGAKETAAMLCKLPIRESIAAIRRTISKDWQGLQPCPRNELHLYLPQDPDEIRF